MLIDSDADAFNLMHINCPKQCNKTHHIHSKMLKTKHEILADFLSFIMPALALLVNYLTKNRGLSVFTSLSHPVFISFTHIIN